MLLPPHVVRPRRQVLATDPQSTKHREYELSSIKELCIYPMNLSRSLSVTRTSIARSKLAILQVLRLSLAMLSEHWPRESCPSGPEGWIGAEYWSSIEVMMYQAIEQE